MPLNVPHTSCSTTYCRNMKRMICRHCSLDPQQTRNTKVDAWHLTNMEPGKALRPMPSNSPDPHAYLCDECLQTWNKQTPPQPKPPTFQTKNSQNNRNSIYRSEKEKKSKKEKSTKGSQTQNQKNSLSRTIQPVKHATPLYA